MIKKEKVNSIQLRIEIDGKYKVIDSVEIMEFLYLLDRSDWMLGGLNLEENEWAYYRKQVSNLKSKIQSSLSKAVDYENITGS